MRQLWQQLTTNELVAWGVLLLLMGGWYLAHRLGASGWTLEVLIFATVAVWWFGLRNGRRRGR